VRGAGGARRRAVERGAASPHSKRVRLPRKGLEYGGMTPFLTASRGSGAVPGVTEGGGTVRI
jgi:hypothetical protein